MDFCSYFYLSPNFVYLFWFWWSKRYRPLPCTLTLGRGALGVEVLLTIVRVCSVMSLVFADSFADVTSDGMVKGFLNWSCSTMSLLIQ